MVRGNYLQQWPQEPCPDFQQEALPCPVIEDLPAFPGQEVEDPCPSTSSLAHAPGDSSSAWDSDSSEADGHFWFVPGTTRDSVEEEEEEWVDVVTVLRNIREQLQSREKDEAQQLMFLHGMHHSCLAAPQRGQDTLEPHLCKAAVVERIVELIEELPDDSPPGTILANSLIAAGNLSYQNRLARFP
ncbi:uncharacterized protein ACDP82_019281 [Pangshura tecta]